MSMVKIYAIKNPISDEVIYVGASCNPRSRYSAHVSGNSWHPITYRHKQLMLMKLLGVKPELVILDETTNDKAKELEQYWIDFYKASGHKLTQFKTSTYPRETHLNYRQIMKLERLKLLAS
jgi:hypothetical protein